MLSSRGPVALSMPTASWIALSACAFAVGCGGGGSIAKVVSAPTTALPKISISWAARSRSIGAPASALSGVVTLVGANPKGGDFTFEIDRNVAPAGYTKTYTAPTAANLGKSTATIMFFGGVGGTGPEVATASESVTLAVDGTGIGDVTLVGVVARVTVAPNQIVATGAQKQLVFTAQNGQGSVVAVSPGSAAWSVASGASFVSVTVDGKATGVATGFPTVVATVDGKASPATAIQVTGKSIHTFTVAAITGSGLLPGPTAFVPTWMNNPGHIVGSGYDTLGQLTAYIWINGVFTSIPADYAACVNDSDVVVGAFGSRNTGTDFSWQNGSITDRFIGNIYGQYPFNFVRVNNQGQIVRSVGSSNAGPTYLRTNGFDLQVVFRPEVGTDLGATGINDQGEIVGQYADKDGITHGYAWLNGNFIADNFGTTFNDSSQESYSGVTNAGEVVIGANTIYGRSWFVGSGGSNILQIGSNPYVSFQLNNAGQAAGSGVSVAQPLVHAVYWERTDPASVQDLNAMIPQNSGWFLENAVHINDRGQIVGTGKLNGVETGFILTPSG